MSEAGAVSSKVRPLQTDRTKVFTEVAEASGSDVQLLAELKSMRGMIASQLSAMSWFDSVRRSPTQTRLLRLLIGNGFSAGLARHFVSAVPVDYSESQANEWLTGVLTRNLKCVSEGESVVDRGGVFCRRWPDRCWENHYHRQNCCAIRHEVRRCFTRFDHGRYLPIGCVRPTSRVWSYSEYPRAYGARCGVLLPTCWISSKARNLS